MEVKTSRFGAVRVDVGDIVSFPEGLPGLEECRQFVLLPDMQNQSLAWLQSTTAPEVALAVVSPRNYVSDYMVRVSRGELKSLQMEQKSDAQVLAIVSVHGDEPTLNLKAPLVINRRNRLGRQVVTNGNQPIRYRLVEHAPEQRRAA